MMTDRVPVSLPRPSSASSPDPLVASFCPEKQQANEGASLSSLNTRPPVPPPARPPQPIIIINAAIIRHRTRPSHPSHRNPPQSCDPSCILFGLCRWNSRISRLTPHGKDTPSLLSRTVATTGQTHPLTGDLRLGGSQQKPDEQVGKKRSHRGRLLGFESWLTSCRSLNDGIRTVRKEAIASAR